MIPQRYLIATLFIAAMLLLFAVVQAPRPVSEGGVTAGDVPALMNLQSYTPVAELRLDDGWAPRYIGANDPDQLEPWPFNGGFGLPWEPASPYLSDQGVALNGPGSHSEVAIWRNLEWRRYRFDAALASARLDPVRGNRLLVTLNLGRGRFETRLIEIPEGRVIWSVSSGPWSRFSWDGSAVLLGFFETPKDGRGDARLLLGTMPLDGEPVENSLAAWDEPSLPPPPKGLATKVEALSDEGQDLPGPRLVLPWRTGDRFWLPRKDRLWTATSGIWTLWRLEDGRWRREATGSGHLVAQPPERFGLLSLLPEGEPVRRTSPPDRADWRALPPDAPSWPAMDPAWAWWEDTAYTAWDLRWNEGATTLSLEHQRASVAEAFHGEWRTAYNLRASVKGWLPDNPEVALRELQGCAWVWVGDRVILVRLLEVERVRLLKKRLLR